MFVESRIQIDYLRRRTEMNTKFSLQPWSVGVGGGGV